MKKLMSLLLVLVLMLTMALPALAKKNDFTYEHEDSGCILTVPGDWKVISEDDGADFEPKSDEDAEISYRAEDVWKALSSSERKKLSREEMDNGYYSKSDIADLFDTKSKSVKRVTLGGTKYFEVSTTETQGFLLFRTTVDVIRLVHVENGWMHTFCYEGDADEDLYDDFEDLAADASYSGSADDSRDVPDSKDEDTPKPTQNKNSDAEIYRTAVDQYERGYYYMAMENFDQIPGYQDTDKYLRLIRIRMAGTNPGMGGEVYNSACGLTDSDKKDINAAAKDFYFADTAEVLLCNSDVACYYLLGRWEGGAKCYIEFFTDKKAGCSYYIGSKLSTNYASTYSIQHGVLYVDILGSNDMTLTMYLTSPDCMEVCSLEKGGNYTLTRK